jgi:putative transposase
MADSLIRTLRFKVCLDTGWSTLKGMLRYKSAYACRSLQIVNERNTTRACSNCGCLTGPKGLRQLAVRTWVCVRCGVSHDRDVNAARNILASGFRCGTSVSGNEPSPAQRPPSQIPHPREAGSNALQVAA